MDGWSVSEKELCGCILQVLQSQRIQRTPVDKSNVAEVIVGKSGSEIYAIMDKMHDLPNDEMPFEYANRGQQLVWLTDIGLAGDVLTEIRSEVWG